MAQEDVTIRCQDSEHDMYNYVHAVEILTTNQPKELGTIMWYNKNRLYIVIIPCIPVCHDSIHITTSIPEQHALGKASPP